MTAVAVSRLRVRSTLERAARAQARVEDALRVAPTAPERLLLVRSLSLGRIAADARPERWQARAADALAEQAARALHAAHPGAAEAGAVWFRSADEARALLLRELAAGRQPSAWFWRLAVPDWDAAPLDVWLPRWIAVAARDPEAAVALARAVVAAAEAGRLPAIIAAVAPALAAPAPPPWRAPAASRVPSPGPRTAATSPRDEAPASAAVRLARRALLALPTAARLALRAAFAVRAETPAVARWLARAAVLAAAPEMASSPAAVAAAADLLMEAILAPAQQDAVDEPPAAQAGSIDAAPVVERTSPRPSEVAEPRSVRSPSPTEAPAQAIAQAAPQFVHATSAAAEIIETASAYAGLLLLVRPLWRLGLADWLEARPTARVDRFARQLLGAIGQRMGADEADPVLGVLAVASEGDWADQITAWRVGLDRWLRRTARVKLADVVKRRGGLLLAGDHLDVRFPLAAADIRLRRHALDLDPLWTPWLGLSIRYHFRDQPLQ